MSFSAADPSILMSHAFGETIRNLRMIDPAKAGATGARIASLLLAIDQAATNGNAIFDGFVRFDLKWRTAVFDGKLEHDEKTEKIIENNLRQWADDGEFLISLIEGLQADGADVESMDIVGLRTRVTQARSMLTPDDEFFEGEDLDNLTAEAIIEDDRGSTVEFRVMGE